MKHKSFSIRTKLVFTFLALGMTPMLVSNGISFWQVYSDIQQNNAVVSNMIAEKKSDDIKDYFEGEAASLVDLGDSPIMLEAFEAFAAPFAKELPKNDEWMAKYREEMTKFYSHTFAPSYLEKSGRKKIEIANIIGKLDPLALAAQYDFIAMNPNALGKKDGLIAPNRPSAYGAAHIKYHTPLRDFLNRHSLYDMFLVDPDGRIVYSVFKETDFATNLRTGPWANSGLAKAFEFSTKLEAGKVHLEDFAAYTPSYEAPASFMSTPLMKDGKYIGSLLIQLPIDKITAVLAAREGLGKNGEVLLLGSDLKLRADTFRHKDTHTVATAFAQDSKVDVTSEAVKRAKLGETGLIENVSYDGMKTLARYSPLQILDVTWYVIVERESAEVFADLREITWTMIATLLLAMGLITTVSYLFGNSIAKKLKGIVDTLHTSSSEVSEASLQSASASTELSEAATEQAASLQETMASIEEISAMVSQNADSAQKANVAVQENQKSTKDGSDSVNEMLKSISEIKQTNDDILSQMETSNREFSEIVKIISEIGSKTAVINEIVFQTKLLSFNASVEAARAGEHGKGFAVVAEEVGSLAQMSGNAAKEISDMLSSSIKKVNDIVEQTKDRVDTLVEIGKDKVSMGQSTAMKCREALNKITENAKSVAEMITEITNASREQAQGVQEINKAISQLDQVTQQNAAVAQQSSVQAEKLSAEASSLSIAVASLVEFVDGSEFKQPSTPEARKKQRSHNVIPLKSAKLSKPAPSNAQKKVAGSDVIPPSDDPGFEEF